jgi:hypothetical protein
MLWMEPGVNFADITWQKPNITQVQMRIHAVWQFCIYESDITIIFQIVNYVMTNLQKIRLAKSVDNVPAPTTLEHT